MDFQLELLPYHYYNTLGFDPEFIDYVDDSIVLEKITPLYKDGGRPQSIRESAFGCTIFILHAQRYPRFGNWSGS